MPHNCLNTFQNEYYNSHVFMFTEWIGVPCLKTPTDLWVYQEIIVETRPDLIIETGTCHGGSAYYLACICDIINNGKVVTIDIEGTSYPVRPTHPRIEYWLGDSVSNDIIDRLSRVCSLYKKVMVILDSDHSEQHVLQELNKLSGFVTPGHYLVVEDTHIGGHPVIPEFGRGPYEAVESFLLSNDQFYIDFSREKFRLTSNPNGFLRKRPFAAE